MSAAFFFVFVTAGGLVFILIELIALAIAERFPKANATANN
jgi:hypothetical protein